jgi:hypothetical protein
MENFLYQCQYCGKEYKPNKRHKQLFCSNSCRTNSHIRNKKLKLAVSSIMPETNKPNQIEKMSLAGVGNAAAGAFIANKVEKFFTSAENKAVTRKDINELITTLKGRYFPIKNGPKNSEGQIPFYDILTQNYLYLPYQKK